MILFLLTHIAAAYYNYYCILGAEWNAEYSKKWHLWQSIFNGLISATLCWYGNLYLALQFSATRFLIFNPVLNLLRGKGFFYLGSHGIDLFFTKLFGKYAGYIYFLGGVILVITLYLLNNLK
jgi:hypothetical protein